MECSANVISSANIVTVCSALLIVRHRRRRQQRKHWIHPIICDRTDKGKFALLHNKLKENPDKFFEFYRMSISSFQLLLAKIENCISKSNTRLRNCVGAEERLSVTLRYLASGNSFRSLHFDFLLGRSTISGIVQETCVAIWETLVRQYMNPPSTEEWLQISNKFEERANFPNCVGSIDGKHIRVINPWGSTSEYFNYKKYHSVVLMAVVDTNYSFRFIDVGAYGHEGDSNVLKSTQLGKLIYNKNLNLPQPAPLKNDPSGIPMSFVFVADEAFAMDENLLRPYPSKSLTTTKRIFNYRLSRARCFVECAFGMLANKWRIFHRPLDVSIDKVDMIVQATCVLHNFVRQQDGYNFDDTLSCNLESIPAQGTRGTNSGKTTRDHFANYFCSAAGAVEWQNRYANIAE